jgi:hypothetical protein
MVLVLLPLADSDVTDVIGNRVTGEASNVGFWFS